MTLARAERDARRSGLQPEPETSIAGAFAAAFEAVAVSA